MELELWNWEKIYNFFKNKSMKSIHNYFIVHVESERLTIYSQIFSTLDLHTLLCKNWLYSTVLFKKKRTLKTLMQINLLMNSFENNSVEYFSHIIFFLFFKITSCYKNFHYETIESCENCKIIRKCWKWHTVINITWSVSHKVSKFFHDNL